MVVARLYTSLDMFRQRTKYRKKGTPGEGRLGEESAERKTARLGFDSQRLRAGLTCVTPPAFVLGTAKAGVLRGRVGHPPKEGSATKPPKGKRSKGVLYVAGEPATHKATE
jgi:hypothetical protein